MYLHISNIDKHFKKCITIRLFALVKLLSDSTIFQVPKFRDNITPVSTPVFPPAEEGLQLLLQKLDEKPVIYNADCYYLSFDG